MSAPTPSPSSLPKYLHFDLSDECQELLSTLPKERGGVLMDIYQYEGFWLASGHLQGLLACQKHFQAQDSDTILVTNPKSGTTWLKAMVFALVNRSQFLDDPQKHPLLTTNPHDLVPFLDSQLYQTRELPDLSIFASPRIFASHLSVGSLPRSVKDSSCKIVYLCRNPKDVFVSFWYFCNKLRPKEWGTNNLEEVFDRFCNGVSEFGPFWDHVLGYWNESLKNPRKILFLKYEEFLEQPTTQLRRLAEFLDFPFSVEEESKGMVDEISKLCSFDIMSNLEVNKMSESVRALFRKGKVGGWAEVLTPEMIKRIDNVTAQKTHDSDFKF